MIKKGYIIEGVEETQCHRSGGAIHRQQKHDGASQGREKQGQWQRKHQQKRLAMILEWQQ